MRVIGVKMVHLTFARGFAVELGAAIVIVVASKYGLPVSSTQVCATQCLVLVSPVYNRVESVHMLPCLALLLFSVACAALHWHSVVGLVIMST